MSENNHELFPPKKRGKTAPANVNADEKSATPANVNADEKSATPANVKQENDPRKLSPTERQDLVQTLRSARKTIKELSLLQGVDRSAINSSPVVVLTKKWERKLSR